MTAKQYIVAMLCWSLSHASSVTAQPKDSMRSRFLREAPDGWKAYLQFAARLQGSIRESNYNTDQGRVQTPTARIATIKQAGDSCLLKTANTDPDGITTFAVTAMNTRYAFNLYGKNPDAWMLREFFPDSSKKPVFMDADWLPQSIASWLCPNLSLYNLWLPTIINDSTFSIGAVTERRDVAAAPLVDVEFTHMPKIKRFASLLLTHGVFTVDPANQWILTGYRAHYENADGKDILKGVLEVAFEYDRGSRDASFPIVRKNTRSLRVTERGGGRNLYRRETILECALALQDDVPESEFLLSAFGLPEPMGLAPPPRSYRWLWIGGAALAALLAGALLRRRSAP